MDPWKRNAIYIPSVIIVDGMYMAYVLKADNLFYWQYDRANAQYNDDDADHDHQGLDG